MPALRFLAHFAANFYFTFLAIQKLLKDKVVLIEIEQP